jgi:hypothetical protein
MNALSIFLGEFGRASIMAIALSLVMLMKRSRRETSNPCPLFVGPKSFTVLSRFAEDQQRRLLDEASKEALAGWRRVVPVAVFFVLLTVGTALGRTLPKVTTFPDSFWVNACSTALFAGFGFWLARQLQVHRVRPFLKALIERTQHAA